MLALAYTKDFDKKTLKALASKGIRIVGGTYLPDPKGGDMAWANGERGYTLDDNGTGRIRTHAEVLELAK